MNSFSTVTNVLDKMVLIKTMFDDRNGKSKYSSSPTTIRDKVLPVKFTKHYIYIELQLMTSAIYSGMCKLLQVACHQSYLV